MSTKAMSASLALVACLTACTKPPPPKRDPPTLEDQARMIELQKTCADQAAKAFRAADYPRRANVINTYTNHYSAKFGRCFMLVNIYDTSKDSLSTFEAVEDAFEERKLGSYFAQNAPASPDHVMTCEEKPVGRPQKSCRSKAEWDAYKALYMDAP